MTESTQTHISKVAAPSAGTGRLNVGTSPPPVGGRLRWRGDGALRKATGQRQAEGGWRASSGFPKPLGSRCPLRRCSRATCRRRTPSRATGREAGPRSRRATSSIWIVGPTRRFSGAPMPFPRSALRRPKRTEQSPMVRVVADTGFIPHLNVMGRLEILPALQGMVPVPPAVRRNVAHPNAPHSLLPFDGNPPNGTRMPRRADLPFLDVLDAELAPGHPMQPTRQGMNATTKSIWVLAISQSVLTRVRSTATF